MPMSHAMSPMSHAMSHAMTGPTLTVPARAADTTSATATVVTHVRSSFINNPSSSAPGLLSVGGATPNASTSSAAAATATAATRSSASSALTSIPALSAIEIPSFDLLSEFDKSFFSFSTSPSADTTTSATLANTSTSTPPSQSTLDVPPPPPPKPTPTIATSPCATKVTSGAPPQTLAQRPATAVPDQKFGAQLERSKTDSDAKRAANCPAATALPQHRQPETVPIGLKPAVNPSPSTANSMVDRPISWLPSSKASSSAKPTAQEASRVKRLFRQNAVSREEKAEKPVESSSKPAESSASPTKKSWLSRARLPPPATSTPNSSYSSLEKSEPLKTKTESKSLTSNLASALLSKLRQKPQTVFSKGSDPSSKAISRTSRLIIPISSTSSSPATTTSSSPTATRNASPNGFGAGNTRTPFQRASSVDTDLDTDSATACSASENASRSSRSTADTTVTVPSRDPLWSTFRMIDLEFARFAAKSTTSLRMGVVRSMLLPFLRSTAYHPSNADLSILNAEDVDRRAAILNRWWNALLAMLAGNNSKLPPGLAPNVDALGVPFPVLQPVAGVDRPTLLEAICMIMMRPEWRACTSYWQPLASRCPDERVRARSATQSSSDSDVDSILMAESAEHNIRTMFIANLTTQMALVVEKLALKHAPLSLINWCGRACAYAFFFVPGVADVLVRLWGINADVLRRVADEFGLPRRNKGESEDIVALFPPHLHKLGWSSVKTLADRLRVAAKLPLPLAKIQWHGPWVSRWRGADTDLFYVFCKHFYLLGQDFMLKGLPLVEKARSPAFVLVHAQLLSILDSAIHGQLSSDPMLGPPISEGAHGADAALLPAPELPSNVVAGMSEHRLIIMLKHMLRGEQDTSDVPAEIKHTFAEAFVAITKAATKRTPKFEHAACFVLCDLLEQALITLHAFQTTVNNNAIKFIDWPFWFDVAKMIMDSNNTMSEIRILSFLFAVWDALAADPARKEKLCLEWLLTEDVFAKFFNHWCPMVRAYYMRLLCWRICRDNGKVNELDTKIYLVASQRLKTVWSHYLWLKQDAEMTGKMQPSTAPCYPAPGKRFVIMRLPQQQQHPMRVGFDSFSNSLVGTDPLADLEPISPTGSDRLAAGNGQAEGSSSFKKRWSLLGKVIPFNSTSESQAWEDHRAFREGLQQAQRDSDAARLAARGGAPPVPPKHSPVIRNSTESFCSASSTMTYDTTTDVFRFILTLFELQPGVWVPFPPTRDRILTRPRLPGPAQARVTARLTGISANMNMPTNYTDLFLFQSDTPPLISPGLPPETRRVSGQLHTGLISEARNARPLTDDEDDGRRGRRISFSATRAPPSREYQDNVRSLSLNRTVPHIRFGGDAVGASPRRLSLDADPTRPPNRRRTSCSSDSEYGYGHMSGWPPQQQQAPAPPAVRAEKPTGPYAQGAVYCGRALAEWAVVVTECNSFIERRRDEGILGLADVEVPVLGVEGLGFQRRC